MPVIRDTASFIEIHREQRRKLDDYLHIPKSNYQTISRSIELQLDARNKRYLSANSLEARLDYAQVAPRKVTLIPDRFAVDLADAPNFDVQSIKDWASEALSGHNFLAVVEVAYFPTWREGRPTISWHVHAILVGSKARQITQDMKPVRRDYVSLVAGIDAAHTGKMPRSDLERSVLYMSKFPLHAYRPYPGKFNGVDPDTGEPAKVPTGRWKVRKDTLRPGDVVRMCRVLENYNLDDLIFGGGSGAATVDAIKNVLLTPFRAEEERREAEADRRASAGDRRRAEAERFQRRQKPS